MNTEHRAIVRKVQAKLWGPQRGDAPPRANVYGCACVFGFFPQFGHARGIFELASDDKTYCPTLKPYSYEIWNC